MLSSSQLVLTGRQSQRLAQKSTARTCRRRCYSQLQRSCGNAKIISRSNRIRPGNNCTSKLRKTHSDDQKPVKYVTQKRSKCSDTRTFPDFPRISVVFSHQKGKGINRKSHMSITSTLPSQMNFWRENCDNNRQFTNCAASSRVNETEHRRRKFLNDQQIYWNERVFSTKSNSGSDQRDSENKDESISKNPQGEIDHELIEQIELAASTRAQKQRSRQPADPEFTNYLTNEADDEKTIVSQSSETALFNSFEQIPPKAPSLEDGDQTEPRNDSELRNDQSSSVSLTDETPTKMNAKASTGPFEWFNKLLDNRDDLGRPTPELNETYRHIERDQNTNLERLRTKQVFTVRRALAGNFIITGFKLAAFLHSGSSAMKAEFIHSVVDCGNQSLLLLGLRDQGNKADRTHPYGYGKSIYFWALVSALGTFFLGAGVSMTQAIPELIHGPSIQEITWHVWGVLGISFAVDGYVFTKTMLEVRESMPQGTSLWKHVWKLRDPATLAILLEDAAACVGIVMAISGIAMTHAFDMPVFDAVAGVGISGLLAAMGVTLVRVNHRFLLGQAVDQDIIKGIEKILLDRISIDHVHSVQSQWTGPETFSYKAEVDFDGTFLAAKLMPRYQQEFAEARATLDQDLRVLLSWYAEDVMRTVEREVRNIEAEIRKEYPGAQYIELEPMSKDSDRFAIDDGMEAQLKRIEIEALNRYLKNLYQDPFASDMDSKKKK